VSSKCNSCSQIGLDCARPDTLLMDCICVRFSKLNFFGAPFSSALIPYRRAGLYISAGLSFALPVSLRGLLFFQTKASLTNSHNAKPSPAFITIPRANISNTSKRQTQDRPLDLTNCCHPAPKAFGVVSGSEMLKQVQHDTNCVYPNLLKNQLPILFCLILI